jgi:hypothetical protein
MVFMAQLSAGNTAAQRNGQQRQSPRQQFRKGICTAALRAFTAGELYRDQQFQLTLAEAALRVGSNIAYVRAAIILLEHGDPVLINRVLYGKCNILEAAASVAVVVKLVTAFKLATSENLATFSAISGMADLSTSAKRTAAANRLGTETVWNDMIAPLMS